MNKGGTLVISRAKKLYPEIIEYLKKFGYSNITITGLERDALYSKIKELEPRIILLESSYHQSATPFFISEILKQFPDQYIAAVADNDFPLSVSAWLIWHGAKSCLHLWADGREEFNRGLKEIKKGNEYVSPKVKIILDFFPDWPDTQNHITKRQFECLTLLCSGLCAEDIANEMNVTRRTVDLILGNIFDVFHVHSKAELISYVFTSGLITKEDLKFFRRDKMLKLPEWAIAKHKANQILKNIYKEIYGKEV